MNLTTISRRLLYLVLAVTSFIFQSCEKAEEIILNNDHEIISFTLRNGDSTLIDTTKVSATLQNDSITITVPTWTDLTHLIPTIVISGVTVSPASGVMQDFTSPIRYTVTAEDGTQGVYVVTIKIAIPPKETLVFFGSGDNNFYALDAKTGVLKWKYAGTQSFAYSSPTYQNGVVYVGGVDNTVYAFKALTGQVLWTFQTGPTGIESDAVIHGGTVYVGSNDDYLYAINAADGSFKWSFRTRSNVSSSPVIFENLVCFGSSDGNMYALDTATGQPAWRFQTGAMINQSSAALANGKLYFGSRDQHFYCVDARTGFEYWNHPTNVSLESVSPTVANGIVYMAGWYEVPGNTVKGSVFALDANTGNPVWEVLPNTGFSSSPYVTNGMLYIGADDLYFYALDAATGATRWKKQILTNSATANSWNGTLYIGGGGTRNFYAFNAVTGGEKWRFPIENGLMTSTPLIVDSLQPPYPGYTGY